MKKALLILLVVWSAIALCAQNNDLTSRDIEHSNNPAFSQNRPQSPTFRDFGFNIAPDYNLPDADDLLDPLTGAFNEDAAWTKDFTRHIVNPESIQLYLTFSNYTHFTITQPDPGNPFKWQFQPIPGNWNGSELVTLTLSDSLPGRPGRTLMTTTVRINVTPVPDPPIWSGLPPDNTFFTDEEVPLLINFQDYVDCVDADSTNFDLFVQPAEFPIDISQAPTEHGYMVIFSPQDDYYGLATYTVTAVDRISNALSSQIINISVQPVNDAPEFQFHLPYSLNQTISQNDSLDFFVIVNDPDNPPETLNVQWILTSVQGRDSQTTMVPGIFGWGHRFTEPGYFTVECLVADSLTSSSLVWNIAVKPTGPSVLRRCSKPANWR
ncbi:MAG TPA: hypothetical protein PLG20_09420, partial [Candidatus Syntrophosphaera sp.]|nr:hypothetical protein [Candidatus Syntrophosphaera sp.]